ncbi:hypothetical protein BRADI_3g50835v3 [Brachypodium distachyon]|uniref:Uncharacterized protein n=1 Tax=Brachypodium distachyon TaxID=15368 RepID=A0A0Q3FM38_BRADI|nr:hypothetical protein BRADI_3g50835v3 [Brachypodium distachyon]
MIWSDEFSCCHVCDEEGSRRYISSMVRNMAESKKQSSCAINLGAQSSWVIKIYDRICSSGRAQQNKMQS